MKTFKTIPEHVKQKRVIDTITCDICKQTIKTDGYGYEKNEVALFAKLGNVYPEGDCRDVFSLDVCAGCFTEKLRPLIESTFGVKFKEQDADDFSRDQWDS